MCSDDFIPSLPHSTQTQTKTDNLEGQVITITCDMGYEFPSAPEPYAPPPAPVTPPPLAPLTMTESQWSDWAQWSLCSMTCGAGAQTRYRDCQQEGMCVGNFKESQNCNLGSCRKLLNKNNLIIIFFIISATAQWTEWTEWTTCPSNVHLGDQCATTSRDRDCYLGRELEPDTECDGDASESGKCSGCCKFSRVYF